jgi:hypothetical protein
MPGHSLIGSVATLDSSSVTCPLNPGSTQPAERALALQPPGHVIWQADHLVGGREYELPGMQHERLGPGGLHQAGQVRLFHRGVDVRVAVVLEDAKVAVQADVDAGRLDKFGRVRGEPDPAGLDLRPDVSIGEQHLGNLPVFRRADMG